MKKAIVVMQDFDPYQRRSIIFIYNTDSPEQPPPMPEEVVVQHVDIPPELENAKIILADIDENDVVSLRLPSPGEVRGA